MKKLKITVLKREIYKDFVDEYAADTSMVACEKFQDGQEFIMDSLDMPEGFCSWAFADIQRDVLAIKLGAQYPWIKQPSTIISCCTDGIRPVIFKIELIDA